ncbi:hypothetical protein [Actinophytocola algeriensis]|uniref:SCO6045-like C-terminal domain-containing protein n=1 Tax=Actinophytocola algeriensis TaxID=1768010 RepID=A0A7W7Q1P2_9PSEU|nr:hypothetical protein [Actinophytocola algeriensis]MBB4905164.1 hypothetical protein [Actinophytocola algeriensis]MBE1473151.1 hypothetical protein [Actinophytocola algeriensis]
MTARDVLAARQLALVRALLAGGPVPDGFDANRVGVEAAALRSKRRSIASHLRPDLADLLEDRFGPLFDTWARDHPKPVELSFRADLDRFETWLYDEGHLERPRRRWFRR